MKKLIFTILSIIFILQLQAEKIIILGDPDMTDIAIAELSNDKDIELLERSQIRKILDEHKLNVSGLGVSELKKYFPHGDIFVMINPDRTVIFNAKNGFRLADEKNGNTSDLIRKSIKKRHAVNPVFLSIITIRDVGIPKRMKSKIEEVVTNLERKLMEFDNIQMLERNRLGAVNLERDVSGTAFELTPSAKLLSMEFEAGSSAEEVKIKIIISDLAKKEFARLNYSGDFDSIDIIATTLSCEIVSKLNIAESVPQKTATKHNSETAQKNNIKHNPGDEK